MKSKTLEETREDVAQLRRRDNASAWPEMEVVKLKPFAKGRLHGDQRWDLRDSTLQALRVFYQNTTGRLKPEVTAELERRAKAGKVHFLDAGPGEGWGLHWAQQISPNIISHGLGLNYPDGLSPHPRGRWIRRHFESTVLKQKGKDDGFFDVIQDHYASMHALDRAAALQNLLNSLRPGGVLYSYGLPARFMQKQLVGELARQGVAVESRDSADTMHVFRRQGNAQVDLARFSKGK